MKTDEKLHRKEKEFRLRRAEILEQAEKIFATKGFHETTMAEIAGASGFSTGSLYHFFSGKEQLYSVMVLEKVHLMYAEILDTVSKERTIRDRIKALVSAHFGYVEHHLDFYRVLVGHESGLRSEGLNKLRERIVAEHLKHVVYIEDLLKEGIRKKVLRALDAKSLATALMGIISYSKFSWIMTSPGTSLSGKVDDVLDVFMKGAADEAGA